MNRDVETVLARHEDNLLDLPNVNAVGLRETAEGTVIVVFVAKKLPVSTLAPEEVIPTELDGYKVVVDVSGNLSALDAEEN